ncbi:peptidase M16 [candidate division GN15 bacterium]|uniref:Peptidase M16 n=1 Tax=candidate division GN15 bacterium TaxID=2072418 RepID=A0A855X823_9BACT|nr:MAG: peptidase M16 [candidate division GN15 bacterium]
MTRRAANKSGIYRKTILRNGLRIVTEEIPGVQSVALGVWVDVGSRNEQKAENGLCHFIEHMLFKGTKRRDAKALASALESLGGSLNGFTSREQTCFYARFLDEHLPTAVDVLADLTCNSNITAEHVEREKKVVLEEIKEALDNPSDKIHDIFAETFWGEHPLGQTIMGPPENILALTRQDVLRFMKEHYRSGSVVVAASGSISHDQLVRMVKQKFRFPSGVSDAAQLADGRTNRTVFIERNRAKQTHMCLGFSAPPYARPEKMTILALSSYLGGGMSSVLFQKVREDRGLAYAVYSFNDFYRDAGVFGVYLGTDAKNLARATAVVLLELRKMKKQKLSPSQLKTLKSQMKGHLILSQESPNGRMNRLARQELMMDRFQTIQEMIHEIEQVSASGICEMANRIFDESRIAVTVLGPVDKGALSEVI